MIVADSSHSGTGAPGLIYGHVGIYVGGGIVMSNEGAITSKSLDSFISFYGTGSGVRGAGSAAWRCRKADGGIFSRDLR